MPFPAAVQPGTTARFGREWRTQRALWCAAAALLAASAVGVLGPGPISKRVARDGPLTVSFDRFVHRHSSTAIRIAVHGVGARNIARFELQGDLVTATKIEAIQPRPLSETSLAKGVAYELSVGPAGSDAFLLLYLDYEELGSLRSQVAFEGHAVEVPQLVYP